ncbi:MAG: extracellular solute-binding protein [Deltaproteobacteria bacterium]|nr:extracellular solute-binding protein [Deltaproteobacteria bacterium]
MKPMTALLSLLSLLILCYSSIPAAWGQSEDRARLIEGAKKEGQLVWYTSMSLVDYTRYLDLFNKKYPFIKVNVRRVGGERLVTIITTEHRAGKTLFDAVITSGVAPSLIRSGIFAKHLSAEFKYFSPGATDPEGYWGDTYTNSLALSYNTRLVPKDKVPQRWEDLLSPQWKGKKIAIDTEPYEWFDTVLRVMGKEKGRSFLKRFGEQELVVVRGNNLRAQQLAAGEFPIGFSYAHQIDRMKKEHAPVEWVKNENIFVVNLLHPVLISAKAAHSNAARLFADFALSKEAHQLMVQLGRKSSSRIDVETDVPKTVRFIPEDLSIYDRINEVRADIEKLLFR